MLNFQLILQYFSKTRSKLIKQLIEKIKQLTASEIIILIAGIPWILWLIFFHRLLTTCTIGNIIAIIFGILGLREFQNHRKKLRAEAATSFVIQIRDCFSYIQKILDHPFFYEYKKYYPRHIPETADELNDYTTHPERPSRLIYNKVNLLTKKLGKPITQIGGEEAKKLVAQLDRFDKLSKSLANNISVKEENDQDFYITAQKRISKDLIELEKIYIDIKNLLYPIITHG